MTRKLKDILEMKYDSSSAESKNVEDKTPSAQLKRAAATKSTAGIKGGIGSQSGINDAPSGTDRGFNDLMKDDESRGALQDFMFQSSPIGQALSKKFGGSNMPDIGPKDDKGPTSTRTSQTKVQFDSKKKQTPW